jgi:hypothetical protein
MTRFIRIIPELFLWNWHVSGKRKIVVKARAGNHKVIGAARQNQGCIDGATTFVICSIKLAGAGV